MTLLQCNDFIRRLIRIYPYFSICTAGMQILSICTARMQILSICTPRMQVLKLFARSAIGNLIIVEPTVSRRLIRNPEYFSICTARMLILSICIPRMEILILFARSAIGNVITVDLRYLEDSSGILNI